MAKLAHDIMIRKADDNGPAMLEIDGAPLPFYIASDVSASLDAQGQLQRLTVDILFDGNLRFWGGK